MKRALLIVSVGTAHMDSLDNSIAATEKALQNVCENDTFFRAFTSSRIRSRLKEQFCIEVDGLEEALKRIASAGFQQVLIQPTFLIPGEEFDRLRGAADRYADSMNVIIGEPLLRDQRDIHALIEIIQEAYPVDTDTILLLVGHGTSHSAGELFTVLADQFAQCTNSMIRLCTLTGTPSLDDLLPQLNGLPQRKILLAPLLLTAGSHASKDIAGSNPNSIRSRLEAEGFAVTTILQGLGEIDGIRGMYAARTLETVNKHTAAIAHRSQEQ